MPNNFKNSWKVFVSSYGTESRTVIKTYIWQFIFFYFFTEPCVRVELMEQIPHVALFCYEHYSLMEAVPHYLLFIILRYLMDSNNQVRKTSQHVLLELLKHELVERSKNLFIFYNGQSVWLLINEENMCCAQF